MPAALLWRSSHQGGHRFAANVLALPEAVQLGRVVPAAAEEVAATWPSAGSRSGSPTRDARSMRARSRPRTLRCETRSCLDRRDVRLVEPDGPRVVLATPSGSVEVTVEERDGPLLPASCGKEAEPMPILETTVHGLEAAAS